MNERIQELYQKAIQSTMDYHKENPKTKQKELDNFCASEFSELIIRECSQLFRLTFTDEQYQRRIDKTILKHFGVEETKREKFRISFEEAFKDGVDLSGRNTP